MLGLLKCNGQNHRFAFRLGLPSGIARTREGRCLRRWLRYHSHTFAEQAIESGGAVESRSVFELS